MAAIALGQCLADQETAAINIEYIRASYKDEVWRNAAERWWPIARQKLEQRAVELETILETGGDFFEVSKIVEFDNLSILASSLHFIMKQPTSCSLSTNFCLDCFNEATHYCIGGNLKSELRLMIERLSPKKYKLNFTHDPRELIWAQGHFVDNRLRFVPDFSFSG